MENCPRLYLVDNLEGEEFQMFESLENDVQKTKLNFILLLSFGVILLILCLS